MEEPLTAREKESHHVKAKEKVKRRFFCSVCQKMHTITLEKSILKNQKKYPFTYIYFHEPKETILTTLYLDAELQIRGAESIPLNQLESNSEVFDPKRANQMLKSMAEELHEVRKRYRELNAQFINLQEQYSDLMFEHKLSLLKKDCK